MNKLIDTLNEGNTFNLGMKNFTDFFEFKDYLYDNTSERSTFDAHIDVFIDGDYSSIRIK